MNAPAKSEREGPRFTPDEIEGFLRFILEGGADKRCSNVYRIITQLRDDLRYHKDAVNHLASEIGYLGETTEATVEYAIRLIKANRR